ncbi:MAG: MFS transporter [Blastocatellia bacterium]|nr:MFS transporter [Blastocatellia bacterium]
MKKTILYFLAFISLGLISGSLGPTIPALAAQTNSAMHEISSLFLVRSMGTMIGALLVGRLYDRVAGHPLLGGSLLGAAAAMALIPSMGGLGLLLLLSVFLGLTSGSINVGGNAMIVQVHGERVRPHMSALHFAFGLGGFLAPILYTQFLGTSDPMRVTYWTLAAMTIPVSLLILGSHSPHHHLRAQAAVAAPMPVATLSLFLLFFFLEVGAEASVMGWYFSYATARSVSTHTAGLMNSGFWAAFTLGRLATIWLSVRFNAISVIIANVIFAAAIATAMLLAPASPWMLWAGAIGFGLAVAPIFPSTFGYAQRLLGLSGKLTALFLVGASAGGMFWPWLIGQFFQSRGPQFVMLVALFDLVCALVVIMVLHEWHAKSPAETTPVAEAICEGQTEPL